MASTDDAFQEDLLIDLSTVTVTSAQRAHPTPDVNPRPASRWKIIGAEVDVYLLLVVGVLLAIGLMMVFSTTFDWSYAEYGSPVTIFLQQVRSLLVGLVVMAVLALIDYRRWRHWIIFVMLGVIFLLIVLLTLPEDPRFGGRRALINNSIQPGEFAQLALVIYLAAWLAGKRTRIRKLTYGLVPFSLLVGFVCALIVLQPDISTAGLIFVTSVAMFFLAGADLIQLGVVGAAALSTGWLITTQLDYARNRLIGHLVAMNDLTQADWHVQQAVIAMMNGGWGGVGLGESRQKFGFLPTPHTDSIFAIIAEELGIIGCVLVVALFVVLVYRGFSIARRAPDAFGAILAAGISCLLVFEALLNIAVLTAVLPFTGVPLPFISFGGSSLVESMAGVGLLLSISRVTARESVPARRPVIDTGDWEDEGARDRGGRGHWWRRLPGFGRR
ncbi:MAG: putative lipid II flippase FtsW [Anaerolineae bacterium]